jgi:hypothetical protein
LAASWSRQTPSPSQREWRRLYHSEPPKISRDLLVLALGYRVQEIEHGGLGKATRRKLHTIAKGLQATGRVGPMPSLSLKPGAAFSKNILVDSAAIQNGGGVWVGRGSEVSITRLPLPAAVAILSVVTPSSACRTATWRAVEARSADATAPEFQAQAAVGILNSRIGRASTRRWLTLLTLCTAVLIAQLDTSVVNLAV